MKLMRPLLVHLTENQLIFLQETKERTGVSMSSYIRLILDRNMYSNSSTCMMIEEQHEVRKTTRKIVKQEKIDPAWKDIRSELSPILAKRKEHVEKWMVQ